MFETIVYKNAGMQRKTEEELIFSLAVFGTGNGFGFEHCSDMSA